MQPHPEAEFKIDNTELGQVCIIGQIRNVSKQATNMTYSLDDGTGLMDVKVWLDAERASVDEDGLEIPDAKPALEAGNWARVWGKLKAFGNNKRHVGAFVIRPVEDKNEITYHLLEAAYLHLYFGRGPPEALAANHQQQHQQGQGVNNNNSLFIPQVGGVVIPPTVSVNARRVMKCLAEHEQRNEGVHTQQIAASTGMPMQDVLRATEELTTQYGLIYSTMNEDTFAILDK